MPSAEFASRFFGFVLAAFPIYLLAAQCLSALLTLGLGLSLYLVLIPIVSRRLAQKLYSSSQHLHGKLFLVLTMRGFDLGEEQVPCKPTGHRTGGVSSIIVDLFFSEKGKPFRSFQKGASQHLSWRNFANP
jgi:hypothetical protein